MAFAFAAAMLAGRADAQQIACGGLYTVKPGDTLFEIAEDIYGNGWLFRDVQRANADLFSTPEKLEVGDRILLPCLDGTGPQTRAEFLRAAREDTAAPSLPPGALPLIPAGMPEESAAPDDVAQFVILAEASGLAEPASPEGGLMPDLVSRALGRAPGGPAFEMHFEADDEPLGFGVRFPHFRPDCGEPGLSGAAQAHCDAYIFSEPVLTIGLRFYARNGERLSFVRRLGDLAGKSICRPAGEMIDDLRYAGLSEGGATLIRAADAEACMALVTLGGADVAAVSASDAEAALARLPDARLLVEIVGLTAERTVHAAARRDDPLGVAGIAALDAGLEVIRATGEWAEVARMHRSDLQHLSALMQ